MRSHMVEQGGEQALRLFLYEKRRWRPCSKRSAL